MNELLKKKGEFTLIYGCAETKMALMDVADVMGE